LFGRFPFVLLQRAVIRGRAYCRDDGGRLVTWLLRDRRETIGAVLPPDPQGWRVLMLSFEHDLAAAHRLAGFGSEVEVLSAPPVRKQLRATAHGRSSERDVLRDQARHGPRSARCVIGSAYRPA